MPFRPQSDNHSNLVNIMVCQRVNQMYNNEKSISGYANHNGNRDSTSTSSSDMVDDLDNISYNSIPPPPASPKASMPNANNGSNGFQIDPNETDNNHSYQLFEKQSNQLNQFYNQLNSVNGYGHSNPMPIDNQNNNITKENNTYNNQNINNANNDVIGSKSVGHAVNGSNTVNGVHNVNSSLNSYNQNGLPTAPPTPPPKNVISPKINGNSRKSYIITNGNAALLPNTNGKDSKTSVEAKKGKCFVCIYYIVMPCF